MPTSAWTISWRPAPIRAVLPLLVHCVAAAAVVCISLEYEWMWIFGCVVLCSAIVDARRLQGEIGRIRMLAIHGRVFDVDGVDASVEGGWLGPGLTVIWLRSAQRREMVSLFRSELGGADHAALRRHLRQLDFGRPRGIVGRGG